MSEIMNKTLGEVTGQVVKGFLFGAGFTLALYALHSEAAEEWLGEDARKERDFHLQGRILAQYLKPAPPKRSGPPVRG